MGADDFSKSKSRRQAGQLDKAISDFAGGRMAGTQSFGAAPERPDGLSFAGVVEWACNRGDGWLRMVPDASGAIHLKWRFTSGPHTGHYIYWKQGTWESPAQTFAGLAWKLDLVDQGELKPTKDVYQ